MTQKAKLVEPTTFPIDTSKYPYDVLVANAQRVTTLLADPFVQGNKDAAGSLDELLGSIQSLIMAEHLDYKDRLTSEKDYDLIVQQAQLLAAGKVPTDGPWIAGYDMNSATYRTASLYHRILKIVTGRKNGEIKDLEPIAKKNYATWTKGKQWDSHCLDKVRRESNKLKHVEKALYPGRELSYADALAAVEELLTLTKAWLDYKTQKP